MAIWYYTGSPLILYNAECKSGGVQKLGGAVFCTRPTAEKLTVLYQINGELVLKHEKMSVMRKATFMPVPEFIFLRTVFYITDPILFFPKTGTNSYNPTPKSLLLRFKVISINYYTVFRRAGTAFCARRPAETAGTKSRAHPAMMVHFFMEIT
ncbi:MAG: hypothetical protein AB7S75_15125 [Desulfococcaceae bacterium]